MAPGPLQIILIIVLVLLIFGAGRVPGIMENVAKGIKSFKKGMSDDDTPSDTTKSDKDE
ncbi:MAG: twin-arginine translocase TatA/TatE family subunit [Alphaproteobacteria bacterium]|nr:twin-arginine translocase TatA/TatE family subunit [Alphaproteobacteria bacterium]|tara:strand:- start:7641 stop:7817 length:177 start_codon:yes stop_codon:yes gene_type:complete